MPLLHTTVYYHLCCASPCHLRLQETTMEVLPRRKDWLVNPRKEGTLDQLIKAARRQQLLVVTFILFAVEEVERFVVDCLVSVGAPRPNAVAVAEVLVAADVRGHYSHGLQRLDRYVTEVKVKVCDGQAAPSVVQRSACTALVDGNNGLGPVVGNFCMDMAINMAQDSGIGWVCARGSNHYGIAGWYAMQAANKGLIGMSFTNASSGVVPTRAKKPLMGTNPIAVAAPGKDQDHFVLDMATSVVAAGKIEVARLKKENIPSGWGVDKDGQHTTDPSPVLSGGCFLPLGGTELHSSYKGFGLGFMVEILCGVLAGGDYGHNLQHWKSYDRPANRSQCFVAVNPAFFASGFEDRMSDLMEHSRNMEPADPGKPVLVAGDPERKHTDKVKSEGGITYHINQVKGSWQLAKFLNVSPMKSTQ